MESEQPELTEYEPPQIVDYGDLAELTEGLQQVGLLDGTFPRETSTFS
jgi:hypothetical protein